MTPTAVIFAAIEVTDQERRAIAYYFCAPGRDATDAECEDFAREQFQIAVNTIVHRHRQSLREPLTEAEIDARVAACPAATPATSAETRQGELPL